jgi:hypothetical protein
MSILLMTPFYKLFICEKLFGDIGIFPEVFFVAV